MDLEGAMLSEISWTEKDNYHMISYTESKKQKIFLFGPFSLLLLSSTEYTNDTEF